MHRCVEEQEVLSVYGDRAPWRSGAGSRRRGFPEQSSSSTLNRKKVGRRARLGSTPPDRPMCCKASQPPLICGSRRRSAVRSCSLPGVSPTRRRREISPRRVRRQRVALPRRSGCLLRSSILWSARWSEAPVACEERFCFAIMIGIESARRSTPRASSRPLARPGLRTKVEQISRSAGLDAGYSFGRRASPETIPRGDRRCNRKYR